MVLEWSTITIRQIRESCKRHNYQSANYTHTQTETQRFFGCTVRHPPTSWRLELHFTYLKVWLVTFSKEVVQWNTRFFQNLKNLDTNVQSRFSHFCHKYYVSSNAKKDENPWSFSCIMKWYRQENSSTDCQGNMSSTTTMNNTRELLTLA